MQTRGNSSLSEWAEPEPVHVGGGSSPPPTRPEREIWGPAHGPHRPSGHLWRSAMLATHASPAKTPAHHTPADDAHDDPEERPVEAVVPRTPQGTEFLGKYDSAGFVDE